MENTYRKDSKFKRDIIIDSGKMVFAAAILIGAGIMGYETFQRLEDYFGNKKSVCTTTETARTEEADGNLIRSEKSGELELRLQK